MVTTSVFALADDDSKEATVYGAFFESDQGWIQTTFTRSADEHPVLKFELEGFEPDDFYLISLIRGDVEMEIAILVPDRSDPPRASVTVEEENWPMDFPRTFNEKTVVRVRDATDAIIFEKSLKRE